MLNTYQLREVAHEAWEDIRATYPELDMVPFEEVEFFTFDSKRVFGKANGYRYTNAPRFGLSTYLKDRFAADETARHEIAHTLTPGHGHDSTWKAMAVKCGTSGDRCANAADKVDLSVYKYRFSHPCGGQANYTRMSKHVRGLMNNPDAYGCKRCNSNAPWTREA